MTHTKPWTQNDLMLRMIEAGWRLNDDKKWQHPAGATTDLNAVMKDGREYWQQLVERHALPPKTEIPF